jgi:hypothetical protein
MQHNKPLVHQDGTLCTGEQNCSRKIHGFAEDYSTGIHMNAADLAELEGQLLSVNAAIHTAGLLAQAERKKSLAFTLQMASRLVDCARDLVKSTMEDPEGDFKIIILNSALKRIGTLLEEHVT